MYLKHIFPCHGVLLDFFSGSLCLQSLAKPEVLELSEQNSLAGLCRIRPIDKIVECQSVSRVPVPD